MFVYVTKEFRFESAHYLPNYEGACSRIHGHSYKLQVTVGGDIDINSKSDIASDYMVMDFNELKELVNTTIICVVDHYCLNDTLIRVPTAEYMVCCFYTMLKNCLPKDVVLDCVRLWETENSFAEYRRHS